MKTITMIGAVTAVILLAGASPLRAQDEETLDTTLTVRGTPRLSVSNYSGEVTVRQGRAGQIRVQAEYERARIEIDETASRVSVRTVTRRGRGEVAYTISVPQGTEIEISGLSTDVDISGVCGEANVNTVSGDLTVVCTTGNTQLQSVSGDVTLTDARGDADISATSGDILVRDVRGVVNAHSVSGDVDVSGVQGADVTAESVSGEIMYAGPIRDNGRYRFVSHSGEVTVRVSGTLNATVSMQTFSGSFESDFQTVLEPGTQISRNWRFRVGTGSARLELESFSGTIYLRRGTSGQREE